MDLTILEVKRVYREIYHILSFFYKFMLKIITVFYSAVTFCNYNQITVHVIRAPALYKLTPSFTNSTVSYEIKQRITSVH